MSQGGERISSGNIGMWMRYVAFLDDCRIKRYSTGLIERTKKTKQSESEGERERERDRDIQRPTHSKFRHILFYFLFFFILFFDRSGVGEHTFIMGGVLCGPTATIGARCVLIKWQTEHSHRRQTRIRAAIIPTRWSTLSAMSDLPF